MSIKTHIVIQEESVDESGVQLRNNDPESPFEGQTWIRKE
jgi:P pilus assembly chaperone PapD